MNEQEWLSLIRLKNCLTDLQKQNNKASLENILTKLEHTDVVNEIAKFLGIQVNTANVRISQIKKEAIDKLISNVSPSQVVDYL
jgi:uncharacterized protein YidB (DUF937 family)